MKEKATGSNGAPSTGSPVSCARLGIKQKITEKLENEDSSLLKDSEEYFVQSMKHSMANVMVKSPLWKIGWM